MGHNRLTNTYPKYAHCNSNGMRIHLPKGDYQIRVYIRHHEDNKNHKHIWKLRSFASQQEVTMNHQDSYFHH